MAQQSSTNGSIVVVPCDLPLQEVEEHVRCRVDTAPARPAQLTRPPRSLPRRRPARWRARTREPPPFPPVLTGQASSLPSYLLDMPRPSPVLTGHVAPGGRPRGGQPRLLPARRPPVVRHDLRLAALLKNATVRKMSVSNTLNECVQRPRVRRQGGSARLAGAPLRARARARLHELTLDGALLTDRHLCAAQACTRRVQLVREEGRDVSS
jgi:hypothetical protein